MTQGFWVSVVLEGTVGSEFVGAVVGTAFVVADLADSAFALVVLAAAETATDIVLAESGFVAFGA